MIYDSLPHKVSPNPHTPKQLYPHVMTDLVVFSGTLEETSYRVYVSPNSKTPIHKLNLLSSPTGHLCGVTIIRLLGYERVYLPLYKVADTPCHIQSDAM